MNLATFQRLVESLSPPDFEKFVFDVLRGLGRFDSVRLHEWVHGVSADIVAVERAPGMLRPTTWYVEITVARSVALDKLRKVAAFAQFVQSSSKEFVRVLVVTTGAFSSAAKDFAAVAGLEIWDSARLAEIVPESVVQLYFGTSAADNSLPKVTQEKANSLSASLRALATGKEDALPYQRLVSEILEFALCPPLQPPRYEVSDADGRNRRDMIFENSAEGGFWAGLRSSYGAHYIVIDAKNYSGAIDKGPVVDIAHYLKPYGCGMFGVLVTRQGGSGGALHAIREQWIGNQKMIVILDDSDLHEMLRLKAEVGHPEETLRAKIASFRMSL